MPLNDDVSVLHQSGWGVTFSDAIFATVASMNVCHLGYTPLYDSFPEQFSWVFCTFCQ